jgi:hypothetical protein
MEVGTRKLLHVNATLHPTSLWTLQQLREAIASDHAYRWLVHDRSVLAEHGHMVQTDERPAIFRMNDSRISSE